MIKFFRNIRQNLIMENKTSKYIKYAIGEIVLVVIGILIALQINTWNEARKDRAFEVKMLHEVRNELIQDTIYFKMIKKRAESALEGAKNMMQIYPETEPISDSVSKYSQMMNIGFQFIYHKGAYEAIKSTGIDKISNDSVRMFLTDMYDFRLPRAQNFIEDDDSKKISRMEKLRLVTDIQFIKMPNGKTIPNITPKKSFIGNTDLMDFIMTRMAYNNNAIGRLESLLRSGEHLLKVLDRELKIENVLVGGPKNIWAD